MAQAYTPGLKVTSRVHHRARRILPISGDVLVKTGDTVNARDTVAQTFIPGDATPVNLANVLSISASDVPACMLKQVGDRIEVGEVIARTKGIFGVFRSEYASKVAGTLEAVSPVTGQVIIRGEPLCIRVAAYVTGRVTEVIPGEGVVIEADVSLIQGIFGIGGEAYGPIRVACSACDQQLSADLIRDDMRGAVVIGGARMTIEAIRKAIKIGAAAVVSGGMDDQDLRDILGYDLGVAVTGSENVGTTLIVTEGFGDIAMARATFDLFRRREGDEAAVNGATQIRAGVMRPEVVIPLSAAELARQPEPAHTAGLLQPGAPVRIIRDPYFGRIGKVAALPAELRPLESGSKARVLEVAFDDNTTLIIPRANVELIET